MASKRVTASALDWGAMALKVRPEQKNGFNGLKMKVDKHLRAVNSLPADLPKVDFAAYKSRIAVPGMVDNFEKAYAGLQIPYPSDQGRLAEIDAQAVQVKAGYETFVAESNTRIAGYTTELAKWNTMKPVEEMNMEEALDAGLTQFVIDPQGDTMFPHDETWKEYEARLKNATPADFH
eukprot:TRINITY_DN2973_c1_g2_i2.p1 TRINITY_DN2973_c1_g2~~TRINITY_DN2973_c1_g2_i2.p1  ORF type:complete len:178 (+),score=73.76 TRINITY_DN2973_c1_g2_i2:31-564(+)